MNLRTLAKRRLRLDHNANRDLWQQVLKRDGWRCQQCGSSKDLQIHHIQPRSRMGSDIEENLITLCSRCHRRAHLQVGGCERFIAQSDRNWISD